MEFRLRTLMHARLDSAAERELARLVEHSARPVHLVCDLTHRLLALSPAREHQCRQPRTALIGRLRWERFQRSYGSAARLVETLAPLPGASANPHDGNAYSASSQGTSSPRRSN